MAVKREAKPASPSSLLLHLLWVSLWRGVCEQGVPAETCTVLGMNASYVIDQRDTPVTLRCE